MRQTTDGLTPRLQLRRYGPARVALREKQGGRAVQWVIGVGFAALVLCLWRIGNKLGAIAKAIGDAEDDGEE